ncbi:hypothetical protein [Breznakia pachnodae]|uniref:Uncharacterized protein n=1 Tax=Breznakia pachnodae TaxID=265178 RepID=A0ABU0DY68_9FIRM|nr:hypothetical protein [Breznakia pachnodae]MDQ0359449.1 hypothetical protein [Breznakia pachnodae]
MGQLRIISNDFIDFVYNDLKPLIRYLKNNKEFILCYRKTNSNEIINIYYKGYNTLKITKYGNNYKGEVKGGIFEINSRRTEKQLPVAVVTLKRVFGHDKETEKFTIKFINKGINDWIEYADLIKECCDNYNLPMKEKKYQQELFSNEESNFLFYDMEYNPVKESKKHDNGGGRFDLIGVCKNEHRVVLAEVKFNSQSCLGKSGIEDHLQKTINYIKLNQDFLSDKIDEIEFWNKSNQKLDIHESIELDMKKDFCYYTFIIRYTNINEKRKIEEILKSKPVKDKIRELNSLKGIKILEPIWDSKLDNE